MRGVLGWMCLALCQCAERAPAADGGNMEATIAPVADAALQPAHTTAPRPAATIDAGRSLTTTPAAGSGTADPSAARPANASASDSDLDAGTADGAVPEPGSEDSSCLNQNAQLDAPGPFAYEAEAAEQLKLWLPKLPAGCKAPIIHFANGTGAACSNYQPVLERFASHGFLTVCAETPTTGSGVPGWRALETAFRLHPDLAGHKLGSAGHEAGGQGAILTLQQAEATWGARATYAGMAIAPTSGHGSQPPSGTWQDGYAAVRSPILVMNGGADALVSEQFVAAGFAALNDTTEAYWYEAVDAPHIPIPNERIQQLAIAWFRWKLLADGRACAYFKQLPASELWDEHATQQAQDCR